MTHHLTFSAASLTTSVTSAVSHHGVYAVLVLMALDALVPLASELTMLVAGALAAGALAGQQPLVFLRHTLHAGVETYVVLALVGTVGYLLGALAGWAIGRFGGRSLIERHGRWLHLSPDALDRAERWFDRYGGAAVFLGRLTPVVRSFISIPAGALECPLGRYTVLTLAGSAVWAFGFAAVGWALGTGYETVHHAFGYVEVVVVAAAVTLAAAVTAMRRRRMRASVCGRPPA